MKKTIIIILISLLAILIYFIIGPKFDTELIMSPNGKTCLTRIDYWSLKNRRTVFTYGNYNSKKIPEIKLEPIYMAGPTDGFYLIMEWKNDTAVFYSSSEEFNNNLPPKIVLKILNGQNENDMKRWGEMKRDTTGRYIQFKQKWVPLFSKHQNRK